MFISDNPNPFEVLGLPIDASDAEIVARGRALLQTAETDKQQQLYHQAIDELTTQASTRLRYELFEMPGTRYEAEREAWGAFARKHKINPIKRTTFGNEPPTPGPEDINMEALLKLLLDSFLVVPARDITPALKTSLFVPDVLESPLEVRDVIFG